MTLFLLSQSHSQSDISFAPPLLVLRALTLHHMPARLLGCAIVSRTGHIGYPLTCWAWPSYRPWTVSQWQKWHCDLFHPYFLVIRKEDRLEKQSLDFKIPCFNLISRSFLFEKKLMTLVWHYNTQNCIGQYLKGENKISKLSMLWLSLLHSSLSLLPSLLPSPLLMYESWRMQKAHTAGPKKVVCIYGLCVLNYLHWCVGGRERFCCLIKSKANTEMGIENNKH